MSQTAETITQTWGRARRAVSEWGEEMTMRVEGEELVPTQGPAILVFDHVAPVERRRLRLGGRSVRFVQAGRTSRAAVARLVKPRGEDEAPSAGQLALERAVELLGRGELVGVLPQDRRSPDGRLYRCEAFVAELVEQADGAPVLPVASLPMGSFAARTVAPRLVVGEALELARLLELGDEQIRRHAVTDRISHALVQLSGREYVDVEASVQRRRFIEARRSRSEALREAARQRRAREVELQQRRRAEREQEAAELAQIQADAQRAAQEQARRAAEADELRRSVRATRMPRTHLTEPFGDQRE